MYRPRLIYRRKLYESVPSLISEAYDGKPKQLHVYILITLVLIQLPSVVPVKGLKLQQDVNTFYNRNPL